MTKNSRILTTIFTKKAIDKDWIKAILLEQNTIGGVNMKPKQKQNKVQPKKLEETKPGFGDKKLEGPDRPST